MVDRLEKSIVFLFSVFLGSLRFLFVGLVFLEGLRGLRVFFRGVLL